MRRLFALLFFVLLLFCGCAAAPAATEPAATPAVTEALPSPSAVPEEGGSLLYLLGASTWQDIYDENYILSFDIVGGTMTEENTALKTKSTYRISIDNDELYAWTEEGGTRKQLPFVLEDGVLSIDYGDPLGVITYAAVKKTP